MSAMVYSGSYIGTVISMPLSGWLCSTSYGWPSVFYICGGLGVFWFGLWGLLAHSDPSTHPRMATAELECIQGALQNEGCSQTDKTALLLPDVSSSLGRDAAAMDGAAETPWRQIFTSMPMWAIVVGHFCNNWGFYKRVIPNSDRLYQSYSAPFFFSPESESQEMIPGHAM